jgi:hypothetical protein
METVVLSEQVKELGQKRLDFSKAGCLPRRVRELLGDPQTLADLRKLQEVLGYTTSHSEIAKILHENPASDAMLRIVYPDSKNCPRTAGLDRYLSQSLSGQALRDRLNVCSRLIAEKFVLPDKRVVDLGGGSGSYAFEAIRIKDLVPGSFVWECLDLDQDAIRAGIERAKKANLHASLVFRQGNFMSQKSVGSLSDYAVLIGVLCGMDRATAINCLDRSKLHLKKGGEIIAATLLTRSFEEDPHTFRILCNIGGWQLRPKTMEQVKDIFKTAGYSLIDVQSERTNGNGQYAIVHARKA